MATEQHTMNFLSVQKPAFVVFSDLCFGVLEPPLLWGAVTFSFLTRFQQGSVSDALRGRGSSFVWTSEATKPTPWIRPALSA